MAQTTPDRTFTLKEDFYVTSRSERNFMKKKFSIGVLLALTGPLVLQNQSQAQVEKIISRDEQHTRESLGFSSIPDGEIVRRVGPVSMTKIEAAHFDRYSKVAAEASRIKPEVDSHPDLLNAFLLPDITVPTVRLTASQGALSGLKDWAVRTFPFVKTEVVEGPVSRAARDQFWNQARAEVVFRNQPPSEEYPKLDEISFPVLQAFAKQGFYVEDVRLGGEDWRVQVVVSSVDTRKPETLGDPKEWGPRADEVIRSIEGANADGVSLAVAMPGSAPKKMQTAPGRPSGADMARGGKEIRNPGDPLSGYCTTGPVVTSTGFPAGVPAGESIISAGHCFTPTDSNGDPLPGTESIIPGNLRNVQIGSLAAQMTIACNDCVAAPPPPWGTFTVANAPRWFWGQGVDFGMMFYGSNPTQNGSGRHYFLEQNGSGQRFYKNQQGSADIFNGQQLVCFEGASTSRGLDNSPANQTSYWYKTSCGTAAGVDAADYRTITLYWGDVICGGDSGSLTHASGWVAGIVSYRSFGIQAPIGPGNCVTSGPISTPYGTTVVNATVGVSSFWKIHQYMFHYRQGVRTWVLTW
jgi:hypothetical protein